MEEIKLNKVTQKYKTRIPKELIGSVVFESEIEERTGDAILYFTHSIYGRQIEQIVIPAVKLNPGKIRRIIALFLPKIIRPLILKKTVLRKEQIIYVNQFFPGLVVPDKTEILYLAISQKVDDQQKPIGYCQVKSTQQKSYKKETSIKFELKGEAKTPFE